MSLDQITLGHIRKDVEKTADKMLLLIDSETGFTVVGAFGKGAEKLSAAVKSFAQTGGDQEAQEAVAALAGNYGMQTTLEQLRAGLEPQDLEVMTLDDEKGKFLNVAVAGDAAEIIYNLLCDIGVIREQDRVADGPEAAEA